MAPSQLVPTIKTEAERSKYRSEIQPWRKWYNSARWKQLRQQILLRDLFTCQWFGCGHCDHDTARLVVHHRQRHQGNADLFWREDNLMTVCKLWHDGPIQAAEKREG